VIVVRVEIWPKGDSRSLRQIESLTIVNLGPADDGLHAYEARGQDRVARLTHRRTDGALVLVARAIEALEYSGDTDPLSRPFDELLLHLLGFEPQRVEPPPEDAGGG
jgi:hypothetical protein